MAQRTVQLKTFNFNHISIFPGELFLLKKVQMSVRRVLVVTQFYGRSLTKGLEYKKVYGSNLTHTLYRYLLSLCLNTDAISTL